MSRFPLSAGLGGAEWEGGGHRSLCISVRKGQKTTWGMR